MVRGPAVVVAIAALVAPAAAETRARIVLVDADPELRLAVTATLAPWHAEIVVDVVPLHDEAGAATRAQSWGARFVVWRDGETLVVFDRERGAAERRPTRAGALDPIGANAAALSVKTMMRLPPPAIGTGDPAPIVEPARELRVELGGGVSAAKVTGRLFEAVMLQPVRRLGLRVGLANELGSGVAIDRAGFVGDWHALEVVAVAGWVIPIVPRFELEPAVGLGATFATLAGTQMGASRTESTTLFEIAAGASLRYRIDDRFAVFASIHGRALPSRPMYTRINPGGMTQDVFQVPGIVATFGLGASVSFGL